ncbi:MAG: hypothetical protein J5871_01930 [Bacteroidales bacterium]|nr:hypothetical protein [Bacteroidales bacterium]
MKKTLVFLSLLLLGAPVLSAQESALAHELKMHFKPYGFVRTYFAFDTHESSAGTEDLYFYMPKDRKMVDGVDVNETPTFRFAALTSRLGLDVLDYEFAGYRIGAKMEADFYAGVTGVTGTAQLRLRQAYVTLAKGSRNWKIGQAWHPMAIDLPDIFSLESGAPFGPFSRTPQVTFDWNIAGGFGLTTSLLWQMQYVSPGPEGNSANYIKYGCTPEGYFGLFFKSKPAVVKVGADVLSIKPRTYVTMPLSGSLKKVSDRITTFNLFEYGQFKAGDVTLKEKVTYANDGSHMNLLGGYGEVSIDQDLNTTYTATRTLSGWATAQWKHKDCPVVPSVLLGYIKNFGTPEELAGDFWGKNSVNAVNQMFRVQPEVLYNLGKLSFGLEYMVTAVEYGTADRHACAVNDLHWVFNHRIQGLVKFTF